MRVSQQRFAKLAQVSPKAVRKARQAGRLVAIAGSTDLDTDDPRNEAYLALHRPGVPAMLPNDAQVGSLIAKAELTRHELEADEASFIDRAAMAARWEADALTLQARLATLPARYADQVAEALDVDEAVATAILERFASMISAEFDGLTDQALDAVARVR